MRPCERETRLRAKHMWSCKVVYYISTFISARESGVIRRTKLKDIQAWSRVTKRNTDEQTGTNSLSQYSGFSILFYMESLSCTYMHCTHTHARLYSHACAHTEIVQTLKCKSNLKKATTVLRKCQPDSRTLIILIRAIWLTHP